jgi:hypothetical protein
MTVQVGPFTIPKTELIKCYNSAIISGAMVSCAGVASVVARDAMGNVSPVIGLCIAAAPHIAAQLIQLVLPNTCGVGISFGSVIGMGLPFVAGCTPQNYALGSMTAAIASWYITAATVHALRGHIPLPVE